VALTGLVLCVAQDVCLSIWTEDHSHDLMWKVTDVCDPKDCPTPLDIKVEPYKVRGGGYPMVAKINKRWVHDAFLAEPACLWCERSGHCAQQRPLHCCEVVQQQCWQRAGSQPPAASLFQQRSEMLAIGSGRYTLQPLSAAAAAAAAVLLPFLAAARAATCGMVPRAAGRVCLCTCTSSSAG
jgi:hypothetical protein